MTVMLLALMMGDAALSGSDDALRDRHENEERGKGRTARQEVAARQLARGLHRRASVHSRTPPQPMCTECHEDEVKIGE